jgi:hypothetical protein
MVAVELVVGVRVIIVDMVGLVYSLRPPTIAGKEKQISKSRFYFASRDSTYGSKWFMAYAET